MAAQARHKAIDAVVNTAPPALPASLEAVVRRYDDRLNLGQRGQWLLGVIFHVDDFKLVQSGPARVLGIPTPTNEFAVRQLE